MNRIELKTKIINEAIQCIHSIPWKQYCTLRVPVRFQTILMSENANLYSPCHTYVMHHIFQKDLSNPKATDLGGEIDVSFIIAPHYFFIFFIRLSLYFVRRP